MVFPKHSCRLTLHTYIADLHLKIAWSSKPTLGLTDELSLHSTTFFALCVDAGNI